MLDDNSPSVSDKKSIIQKIKSLFALKKKDAGKITVVQKSEKQEKPRSQKILVGFFMAISIIYFLNPTAGLIELIPDNFPVIGNLDEAGMATLFIYCLQYFREENQQKTDEEENQNAKKNDNET